MNQWFDEIIFWRQWVGNTTRESDSILFISFEKCHLSTINKGLNSEFFFLSNFCNKWKNFSARKIKTSKHVGIIKTLRIFQMIRLLEHCSGEDFLLGWHRKRIEWNESRRHCRQSSRECQWLQLFMLPNSKYSKSARIQSIQFYLRRKFLWNDTHAPFQPVTADGRFVWFCSSGKVIINDVLHLLWWIMFGFNSKKWFVSNNFSRQLMFKCQVFCLFISGSQQLFESNLFW